MPTDFAAKLLDDLTEPQRQAVTHVEGPLLVLAGAGSGKTRVVTRRVAHLVLEVGIPPWNVLAITFTNKAAGEMRERVKQLVSERQGNAIVVATFHSLCSRLLRQYRDRLNLKSSFSIYDTADQQKAMKQALEATEVSSSNFPPSKVLHTISNAKNELIGPEDFAKTAYDFYSKSVAKLYAKYQQILEKNNAMDFDDLLMKTVHLLRDHPDVLNELRERFAYLLIDEYQDTNHAQFVLAHALAAEHRNICATGDPDQSIYGWRGANISNILEFETHYPNATVVRLEQNYRSTKSILGVADKLIQQNRRRKHKSLWTDNEAGDAVRVVVCHDERREAQMVVDWFMDLHIKRGIPWSGLAVFYRTNSLSRVMEDALRTANVPYQIARGTSFYQRKEIKDAISYFRTIANPEDEVNLVRIINLPARGISSASVKSMQAHAVARHVDLNWIVHHPDDLGTLNTRAVNSIKTFAQLLDSWRRGDFNPPDSPPTLRTFVERVLRESGLEDHYRNDKSDPDGDRIDNLGELVSAAQQFEDELQGEYEYVEGDLTDRSDLNLAVKLDMWLEQIALVSDIDSLNDSEGAVTLMTLHAAKGLEFPAVAMIGVEDGLLPHERSIQESNNVEEERRLCFVGITRAQRLLTLSHTRYRTIFGSATPSIPSRFLDEIPKDMTEKVGLAEQDDAAFEDVFSEQMIEQRQAADALTDLYPPGALVRHPQFGLGRIITVSARGSQTRARVEFNIAGVKTLILQFARLERVE
jgi:DNA helicase-2/ATP-dependent DNA helicase PcrA